MSSWRSAHGAEGGAGEEGLKPQMTSELESEVSAAGSRSDPRAGSRWGTGYPAARATRAPV